MNQTTESATLPCETDEIECGAELGAVDGICHETEVLFDMMSGEYRCADHFGRDRYGSDGEGS